MRSFLRDLCHAYPGSVRFNRGGTGVSELNARLRSSGASGVLVVYQYRGNPGRIHVIRPATSPDVHVMIDSGMLRREVCPDCTFRIRGLRSLSVASSASTQTRDLATIVSELARHQLSVSDCRPAPDPQASGLIDVWFEDLASGKTLWSHYHAADGLEMGPRVRVFSLRRQSQGE
ncbi:MAG: hypothetical protein HXY34_06080 [Candidatus Thorarchaeota archaeon]|nr:hypothetical protein [Candidatus Thorarchaeota archaeon]